MYTRKQMGAADVIVYKNIKEALDVVIIVVVVWEEKTGIIACGF